MASQWKVWKQQGARVTALAKLKALATARSAPGVGDVLVMQHVCSRPILRCSKWTFFYKIQMPVMQVFPSDLPVNSPITVNVKT